MSVAQVTNPREDCPFSLPRVSYLSHAHHETPREVD